VPRRRSGARPLSYGRGLSRGDQRLQLHCHQYCGVGDEAEVGRIFTVQVKRHGLAEIGQRFVERETLRHNRDIHAFGHMVALTFTYDGFDCLLKATWGSSLHLDFSARSYVSRIHAGHRTETTAGPFLRRLTLGPSWLHSR
jgi:hypothetical protein